MKRYLVQSDEGLGDMLNRVDRRTDFAFDYEYDSSPGWWTNPAPVGVSFAVKEDNAYAGWYVPMGHNLRLSEPYHNMAPDHVFDRIRPLLEDQHKRKIMQSAEVESGFSKLHGIEIGDNIDDTMIMGWMYEEERLYPYSMAVLCQELLGKRRDKTIRKDIKNAAISDACMYDTDDAIDTHMLRDWLEPEIRAQELYTDYDKIERPLVRVLRNIVMRGVSVDVPQAESWRTLIEERQAQIEREVQQLAGVEFNPRSKQQLGNIMFDRLNYRLKNAEGFEIAPERTAKSGQYRLADEVLAQYAAAGFPIAVLMREHGDYDKLRGTYLTRLIEGTLYDGFYHPSIWQCGTKTGRYTSDMQQFPRDPLQVLHELVDVRRLLRARPGHWLIVADYNQLELRVLAHFTEDPVLVACYMNGEDLHQGTADSIREAGAKISRQDSKPINFGLVYGLALATFIEMFGAEIGRAVHAALMRRFQGIFSYKAAVLHLVHLEGFIRTIAWRKRRFRDINASNPEIRSHAERAAFNTRIQGSAADLVKMAQILCERIIPEARQLLQVHDEILFEVEGTKKQALEAARVIKGILEGVAKLRVPLIADPGVGQTWRDAKAA